MKKVELDIVALSHSVTQSHNYAVVLGEQEGSRRLPIVIGGFEAQAIAVAMERMTPNRPLTHDLFKNTLETFDIELKEVIINNLLDGIFYARLVCVKGGDIIEIDSRTSDALAMAVRFDCPIYTYEFILDAAGVVLEDQEDEEAEAMAPAATKRPKNPATLSTQSLEELNQMLDEVLEKEDYEQAAKIRDEINRRKGASS
jgi:bifunctional DNase/RNase